MDFFKFFLFSQKRTYCTDGSHVVSHWHIFSVNDFYHLLTFLVCIWENICKTVWSHSEYLAVWVWENKICEQCVMSNWKLSEFRRNDRRIKSTRHMCYRLYYRYVYVHEPKHMDIRVTSMFFFSILFHFISFSIHNKCNFFSFHV